MVRRSGVVHVGLASLVVLVILQAAPAFGQLSITTTTLPNGTQGAAYSQALAATGGTEPYTWSLADGTLPAGLSLHTDTGVIDGTPTAIGSTRWA